MQVHFIAHLTFVCGKNFHNTEFKKYLLYHYICIKYNKMIYMFVFEQWFFFFKKNTLKDLFFLCKHSYGLE